MKLPRAGLHASVHCRRDGCFATGMESRREVHVKMRFGRCGEPPRSYAALPRLRRGRGDYHLAVSLSSQHASRGRWQGADNVPKRRACVASLREDGRRPAQVPG